MNIVIHIPAKPAAIASLRELGHRVTCFEPDTTILPLPGNEAGLPEEAIAEAEVLVCKMPPGNHACMRALRLVQISSVGYAQLYPLKLPERGARACNARGVYDTAIAEWNVAMMINLRRHVRLMLQNQERGLWQREGPFQEEIRGGTLGLWGYGGIGRATARLAEAFGMRVHVMARRPLSGRDDSYCVPGAGDPEGRLPDAVFLPGQELEFLAGLDHLVLAMPLTPQNKGLLGERELRAMKPTATLLNPARGALVQEEALVRALREGWLAGAALDTHHHYPMPPDHPLWSLPNVIMTPHISGSDKGAYYLDRIWEIVMHNIIALQEGRPLWNELTEAELRG